MPYLRRLHLVSNAIATDDRPSPETKGSEVLTPSKSHCASYLLAFRKSAQYSRKFATIQTEQGDQQILRSATNLGRLRFSGPLCNFQDGLANIAGILQVRRIHHAHQAVQIIEYGHFHLKDDGSISLRDFMTMTSGVTFKLGVQAGSTMYRTNVLNCNWYGNDSRTTSNVFANFIWALANRSELCFVSRRTSRMYNQSCNSLR